MSYYAPTADGRFQIADDNWQDELERKFGRYARDVRYAPEGRGEDGSKLRRLWELRTIAYLSWEAARNNGKA